MNVPSTVDVACPRCDVPIKCTLVITQAAPKPGARVAVHVAAVPDLAEHFAAHYRDAGHAPPAPGVLSGAGEAARVGFSLVERLIGELGPDADVSVAPTLGVQFAEPFTTSSASVWEDGSPVQPFDPAKDYAAVVDWPAGVASEAAVERRIGRIGEQLTSAVEGAARAAGRVTAEQEKLTALREGGSDG